MTPQQIAEDLGICVYLRQVVGPWERVTNVRLARHGTMFAKLWILAKFNRCIDNHAILLEVDDEEITHLISNDLPVTDQFWFQIPDLVQDRIDSWDETQQMDHLISMMVEVGVCT